MRNQPFAIGQRHTRNLILDKRRKTSSTFYFVRCDCGNERWIRSDILRKNKHGCSKCYALSMRKSGEGHSINSAWKSLTNNARTRGIPVEISKEEFVIVAKQECFYCGEPPKEKSYYDQPEWATPAKLNGIDRVDNARGYSIDNIVSACGTCNRGKMDLSLEDFKSWIIKLSKREWINE